MKRNSLTRKMIFILSIKLILLICIWKLFFSEPLPAEARKAGLEQLYFADPGEK